MFSSIVGVVLPAWIIMIGIVMTNKIQRGQAGRRIVELLRANAQLLRDLNNFRAENIPAADVLFFRRRSSYNRGVLSYQ